MDVFDGRLALITGAGSGIGRALAHALARAGAHLALCDLFSDTLEETRSQCAALAAPGRRVTAHVCDVAAEPEVLALSDAVLEAHATTALHFLFNNAGIGGGGSLLDGDRARWERTFDVDWFGVYYCTRAFLPALVRADRAWLVNVSSVNGLYAHELVRGNGSAYAAAKFAVRGLSEALVGELRARAPHVRVALVLPGHVGTNIVHNSLRVLGLPEPKALDDAGLERLRRRLEASHPAVAQLDDAALRALAQSRLDEHRERAPLGADAAAAQILAGIEAGRFRVLVGKDAEVIDARVRREPERAYEPEFIEELYRDGVLTRFSS